MRERAHAAWPAASSDEPGRVDDLKGRIGQDLDAAGRGGGRPRHLHAGRHRLGRRGAHRARGARRVLAGRADRHGGLAALRRARRRSRPRSSRGCRPGRTGSSSGPTRSAPKGALQGVRHRAARRVRPEESVMARIDYTERIPNNVSLAENRRLLRALEEWQPQVPRLVARHGARRLPGQGRLPAHRDQRGRPGLGALRLREDAGLPLGHLPRRAGGRTARIAFGEHKGTPAWQDVPGEYRGDAAPAHRDPGRHRARLGRAAAPPRAHAARRSTTCATSSR